MGIKININLTNKWLYTLIVVGIVVFLGIIVYGYANPITGVGHGLNELEPCGEGEILQTNAGIWTCINEPSFVDTDTYCNINMSENLISCPDGTSLYDTNVQTQCNTVQYLRADGNCRTANQVISEVSCSCGVCWNTEAVTFAVSNRCEVCGIEAYYRMCTPGGWKQTSNRVCVGWNHDCR